MPGRVLKAQPMSDICQDPKKFLLGNENMILGLHFKTRSDPQV